LRLKLRTNQLDNPANYRKARRELARILTLIAEQSLKQRGGSDAAAS
jgi:ribosomal protein L29